MCRFTASRKAVPSSAPPELPADFLDDFNWFDAIDDIVTPGLTADDGTMAITASSDSTNSSAVPASVKPEAAPLQLPAQPAPEMDLLEFFAQQLQAQGSLQPVAPAPQVLVPQFVTPTVQLPIAVGVAPAGAAVAMQCPAGLSSGTVAAPAAQQFFATSAAPGADPAAAAASRQNKPWLCNTFCDSIPRHESTADLIEDPTERMKQKRRESAQRSRARKNAYMKQLEAENKALKDEVARLKDMLNKVQPCATLPAQVPYGGYMVAV